MNIERIIFTGGGSGGHVMPGINLIKKIKSKYHLEIRYIGSKNGIEKKLINEIGIPYKEISSGKLRRYLSVENIIDIFKVILGIIQSIFYLLTFDRKTIIFSTGGFVSVPVIIAAFITFKKIYIHEQTSRVGLANKIGSIFATKVFISFKKSIDYFPKHKTVLTGYPVREELFLNEKSNLNFEKPNLFFTGGGNGSKLINDFVDRNISVLLEKFEIHHQVGSRFIEDYLSKETSDYHVYDFVTNNMNDLLKNSSVIVSRAGAGMVCELLTIGKKSIYIPLKIAQKNEQYHNAMEAKRTLNSIVVTEDLLAKNDLNLLNEILKFKEEKFDELPLSKNGTHQILLQLFSE